MREANIGSLNISHLLFANNAMLFCEVTHDHICTLRALRLCFEFILELKVNLGKSYVVLVGQVHNVDSMLLSWDVRYLMCP